MLKKLFFIGLILTALGFLGYRLVIEARRVGLSQGYQPDQPIAFSHKLHAGDNQVPCQYCHFAAERSRYAGIPPAALCLNCHRQIKKGSLAIGKVKTALAENKPIEWIKVHNLPDFVYFNHSQHVKAGKVACQDCHGEVERMVRIRQVSPLSMGWCLDCHRARGITPPEGHEAMKKNGTIGGLDCAKCHY